MRQRGAAAPAVITSPPAAEAIHDTSGGEPAVRAYLHRPAGTARAALVLAHGAGSDANAPLLVALAAAFAVRGVLAARCDLPFRQSRPTGPPSPGGAARDREGLRRAVALLRRLQPGPVLLGGASYGGRQSSMLAAEEPGLVGALLLLSYPLHPPGQPARPRTAHFAQLRTPALFAHGSVDTFGSLEELEAARLLIPARTALLTIHGAGHGLGPGARGGRPAARAVERIVEAFLGFIEEERKHDG